MRRLAYLFFLFLATGLVLVWLNRVTLLYQPIDQAMVKPALESVFQRQISYDHLAGSLIFGLRLENVLIPRGQTLPGPTILEARQVRITYNLLKLLLKPKDFIGALDQIELIEPKIYLERNLQERWNILEIFLAEGGRVPPFYARLKIKDGQLAYLDQRGFGPRPLSTPFQTEAGRVNGWIDFHKNPMLEFSVTGQAAQATDPAGKTGPPAQAEFSGTVNSRKVKFALDLKARDLPLAQWYDYAVKIPGLSITSGRADLDLKFADKPHAGPLPCLIEGTIDPAEAATALAGLPAPFKQLHGRLKLTRSDLIFSHLSGTMGALPFRLEGALAGYTDYDLKIDNPASPLTAWQVFWPDLPPDLLSGSFRNESRLTGPADQPRLTGRLSCQNLKLGWLPVKEAALSYDFQKGRWRIDLASAWAAGGLISGQGQIDTSGRQPQYSLNLDIKKLDLAKTDQTLAGGLISGRLALSVQDGQSSGQAELTGVGASILGQLFTRISGRFSLSGTDLVLDEITIRQKDSDAKTGLIDLSGQINEKGQYQIKAVGRKFFISQTLPGWSELPSQGQATFTATIKGRPPRKGKPDDQSYQAEVNAVLEQPVILGQPFAAVAFDGRFDQTGLDLKKMQVNSIFSRLNLRGRIPYDDDLALDWEGRIRIEEFTAFFKKLLPFLQPNDTFSGQMEGLGRLTGRWPQITFSGQSRLKYFTFNDLSFSLIDVPSWRWQDNWFDLAAKGAVIAFGKNQLTVAGRIKLLPNGDSPRAKDPAWLKASFKIDHGELKEIVQQGQAVYRQLALPERRVFPAIFLPDRPAVQTPIKPFQVPPPDNDQAPLEVFRVIRQQVLAEKTPLAETDWSDGLAGSVKGQLDLSGTGDQISGDLALILDQGRLKILDCSRLDLTASFGVDPAHGHKSAWPFLPLVVDWRAVDGHLLSAKFDRLTGRIEADDRNIFVKDFNFSAGQSQAGISGTIPLTDKNAQPFDLTLKTSGESVRILAAFFKEANWLGGTGDIDLALTGSLDAPRLDGHLTLKNAAFQLATPTKSQIKNLNADLVLANNVCQVKKLNAHWQGEATLNKDNYLEVDGQVTVQKIFRPDWQLVFQGLKLRDGVYYLNLQDFFSGSVTTGQLEISGSLNQPILEPSRIKADLIRTNRPVTIAGRILINEGRLTIPTGQATPLPAIGLNIDLTWGNNFRLLANNLEINPGDSPLSLTQLALLNSLNFQLAPTNTPVNLRGSFVEPVLETELIIMNGSFNFLGRTFNLLKPARQRQFISDRTGAEENYLAFAVKENFLDKKNRQDIRVNLAAETLLPERISSSGNAYLKSSLLVFISGSVSRIKIFFEQYDQRINGRWDLAARYDLDQLPQVVRLILPSYLSNRVQDLASRRLLADLTSQQFQALFRQTLQPFEERFREAIGLEEFQFGYNFGYRLSRGLFPEIPQPGDSQTISITAAKRLFLEKLYIRVNLNEDLRSIKQGDVKIPQIDYQISYWLNDSLSVDYTRENIGSGSSLRGYDIYSLQYRYSF